MSALASYPRRLLAAADALRKQREFDRTRKRLASRLQGEGVEIGALHRPLPTPSGARVRYVDRLDEAGLRSHYPELADKPLVAVHVVADGELLDTLPDASQDFLIANHFLEHTEDPIGTLENHVRVVKPGGVLYFAVPVKDATFDARRERTPFAHLERDHQEGPRWSRAEHYDEWARLVDGLSGEQADARARDLEARGYSIHFHVWDPPGFGELLERLVARGMPIQVETLVRNQSELIALLRRRDSEAKS